MRLKRGKILTVLGLLLLAACSAPTGKELDGFYKSNIFTSLQYEEEVGEEEEFTVRFDITNNLEFPITLSSIYFPFSDFNFIDKEGRDSVEFYPITSLMPAETNVFEYTVKKNMEDNLGSGVIISLIGLKFVVEDPKYGTMEIIKKQDFILEFT